MAKTKELEPESIHANGVTTLPTGPRMPRRLEWVDLPSEYPGMRVQFWLNYPSGLNTKLRSGDEALLRECLSMVIVAHNGWLDEDGEPFPPSTEPAFWDAISDELMAVLIALLMAHVAKLPNLIRTRGTS